MDMIDDATESIEQQPICYILNPDCWEEIFEWLSIFDIHAIGQTCKRLNAISGYYFRHKYKNVQVLVEHNGIYVKGRQVSGFSKHIENVTIDDDTLGPFDYLESMCNKSLKEITFDSLKLNLERINRIKNALKTVERIHFMGVSIVEDLFDEILKFCPKLKCLEVLDVTQIKSNNWLKQKYPALEYFSFVSEKSIMVPELKTFFTLNSNIKIIETDTNTLRSNWQVFKEANLKLDEFHLDVYTSYDHHITRHFLAKRHTKGFYKRLHLYNFQQLHIESLATLPSLTGINTFTFINLSSLRILKELKIDFDTGGSIQMWEMIAKNLVNLKRLSLSNTLSEHILPFIQYSAQLQQLIITYLDTMNGIHFNNNAFDLFALNKIRLKLPWARKLVMYVEEDVFVATKWANNDTDWRVIAIKGQYETKLPLY